MLEGKKKGKGKTQQRQNRDCFGKKFFILRKYNQGNNVFKYQMSEFEG